MVPTKKTNEFEIEPDGWQRFERAIAVVVKVPRSTRKLSRNPEESPEAGR